MRIKDICIGDSRIVEYRLDNTTLTMILEDHEGASYEIVMHRCNHILVRGSVGFSLSKATFVKNEAGDHWCFHDEDGAVMALRFDGYAMRQIHRAAAGTFLT